MADSANVSNSEFFVIGQLLVGAKHLEDKLSVIAKNSSPNASPVQLFVVSCSLLNLLFSMFPALNVIKP
ncbi:MAG: hypothetical protein HEQ24_07240 [Dolichospermum sp. BR01]|nr:hypothetical protein [Dolichospermum sp. BR01]